MCPSERTPWRHIFSGLKILCYICIHYQCSPLVLLMVWRYINKQHNIHRTLTLRKSMRASWASELGKFSHFDTKILLFLSIFCWYFRYFVGTNDMIVRLNVPTNNVPIKLRKALLLPPIMLLFSVCTIIMLCFLSVHFWVLPLPPIPQSWLRYGWLPPNVPTEEKKIKHITYACARERSERAPQNHISFQVSKYVLHLHTSTINVVPFYYLWYGALNDSIPTYFRIFILKKCYIFLSIFCWPVLQILSVQMTWFQMYTNKTPKSIIGGGGGGGGTLVYEGKASFLLRERLAGQSQWQNICSTFMREWALQKHIHFRVSKADISVRSHILATRLQLLISRSV